MILKENSDLNLDLVFKLSKTIPLIKNQLNKEDSLIFQSFFWEKVFLSWIKVMKNQSKVSFSNKIFNKKLFSLSFEIIDNHEIAILNQRWLNKTGSTDVLSFPIIIEKDLPENFEVVELGDLFISLEMAIVQSLEYGHSVKKEMLWLASHGFLHLLGWDHNNDKELNSMLNFQEYLISELD